MRLEQFPVSLYDQEKEGERKMRGGDKELIGSYNHMV